MCIQYPCQSRKYTTFIQFIRVKIVLYAMHTVAVIITSNYKIRCMQSSSKIPLFLMSCLSLIFFLNLELSRIVHYDTSAGSSISHTLGKNRVLKNELSTRRIKKFCTIHVRERDSRLVCLSTLASLGCKRHTRQKSTFPH